MALKGNETRATGPRPAVDERRDEEKKKTKISRCTIPRKRPREHTGVNDFLVPTGKRTEDGGGRAEGRFMIMTAAEAGVCQ